VAFGIVAGFFINLYLSKHGISLSEPFSYGGMKFTQMLSDINFRMFFIPAVTVFISGVLVGFFPALKAGRTEPAKTMRMH
jgi:ABC-type lipoprotein release transport system permease subunit